MDISKKDWALFRAKLPQWQERHMDRLNSEYIEILRGPGDPSEKFWAVNKRIKEDRRHPGVIVSVSRSNMIPTLLTLLNDQVITEADIVDFSEDLRDALAVFRRRYDW